MFRKYGALAESNEEYRIKIFIFYFLYYNNNLPPRPGERNICRVYLLFCSLYNVLENLAKVVFNAGAGRIHELHIKHGTLQLLCRLDVLRPSDGLEILRVLNPTIPFRVPNSVSSSRLTGLCYSATFKSEKYFRICSDF